MEGKGAKSLKFQMGQLYKKIGFPAVPNLASNEILGTVCVGNYVKMISPKTNFITLMSSRPNAIIYKTCQDHVTTTESYDSQNKTRKVGN